VALTTIRSEPLSPSTEGRRVRRFVQHLTLGGSYLGQPFRLLTWQRDVIDEIYLLNRDGRRKHRTAVLGIARKNGKTQLAAALALYHLCADTRDAAPEVICAANTRDQARLLSAEVAHQTLNHNQRQSPPIHSFTLSTVSVKASLQPILR
jgi:phage terminase large subunit-like protein